MGNPSSLMIGTITALYDVGAVIGAVAAAFTAEPLGRKRTFLLGTTILIIGTILMGSSYSRAQMMVARVFTGIGIGSIKPTDLISNTCVPKRDQQSCSTRVASLLPINNDVVRSDVGVLDVSL